MPFIMDGLETESYDRQYRDRDLLKRIAGYFGRYRGKMVLVACMLTLNSLFGTAGPILISESIVLVRDNPDIKAFALLSGGVLLLGRSG